MVGIFFYLEGVWMPLCLYALICSYVPLYICMPPGVYTPIGPHALLCTCMVLEHLLVVGGCYLLLVCVGTPPLHHPYLGCLPLNYTPHTQLLVPCAILFSGILVSYVGLSPSVEGFGGCSPITWGGLGGTSALQLSIC